MMQGLQIHFISRVTNDDLGARPRFSRGHFKGTVRTWLWRSTENSMLTFRIFGTMGVFFWFERTLRELVAEGGLKTDAIAFAARQLTFLKSMIAVVTVERFGIAGALSVRLYLNKRNLRIITDRLIITIRFRCAESNRPAHVRH